MKRLSNADIRIWDVRQTDAGTIRCRIPARCFFRLRKLRKELPIRIRIIERGGLPFLLHRLHRRPVLWIGSVLLFSAIAFLSTRIWIIRIEETNHVDPNEILDLLEERGIRSGARLEGPILITAANDLSAQVRNAAWIGLDREGILLSVKIVESLPESPKKNDRIPSDIVAAKDGIVTSIQVMRGQARVKVGDRVQAGDTLISGTVLYKDQSTETAADGTVYAAVEYRAEAELPDRVAEAYETGSSVIVRILTFWGYEITRTGCPFGHYRLDHTDTVTENGVLPFAIRKRIAQEIGFRERMLSGSEAEEYALIEAREKAYGMIPKEAAIINTYGTIQNRNGKRFAVVIVTTEELIGTTEERPHDG